MTHHKVRPEMPGEKGRAAVWYKPWVTWKLGTSKGSKVVWLLSTPRGLRHDPDRTRAKYLRQRARQGKDRR